MNATLAAEVNRKIERARTILEAYNRNPNLFTGAALANVLEKLIPLCRELVEERPGRCSSCCGDCVSLDQEERQ